MFAFGGFAPKPPASPSLCARSERRAPAGSPARGCRPWTLLAVLAALALPLAAHAQPAPPGCTNADGTPCPVSISDLCKARLLDMETEIKGLGAEMCSARDAARTKE